MPGKGGQRGRRVGVRLPRVDHDRETQRVRDLELAVEDRALHIARREIVVVVEPCLTDGNRIPLPEQLHQLADPRGVRACGLVRVDPERGEHTLLGTGDRKRRPA